MRLSAISRPVRQRTDSKIGAVLLDPSLAWWSYPLLVLDFETTGVDPEECEPVSVAAVRYEQGVERGHFYSLLDPGCPIPPGATEIHGIGDAHVVGAPRLEDVAVELLELAAGALPCAYNAAFDRTIFRRKINGIECPLFNPEQRWICALVMVRKIDRYAGGTGRHKLVNVCKRYGEPLSEAEAHNALNDVRATGRLLTALVKVGKLKTATPLGRMLDYIDTVRAAQDADYAAYRARIAAREAQRELSFDHAQDGDETPCPQT